jgi:hypothetical protein
MFSFDVLESSDQVENDAVNDDVKTIAFVLYPELTPLDLIGPLQVMSGLEVVEATFGMQPRHHVVVTEHLGPVPTDTPVQVAATTTLDEVPAHSFSPAPDLCRAVPRPPIGRTTAFSSVWWPPTCRSAGSRTAATSLAPEFPPGSIPLCDSRPYSRATTLRARSNSLSSTTHSRRTAASTAPTSTGTASDLA